MMKTRFLRSLGVVCLGVSYLCTLGCGQAGDSDALASAAPVETHHDHPSEGPHHGALIELGDDEYHAEMVHDEAAGSVTVYLFGSKAQLSVPIDAKEVLINLTHDGQAEQFSLAAKPQAGDPSGQSSVFVSTDAELAEDLDNHDVSAKLVVEIGGKQFRGAIDYDHDHEAHGHEDHGHHDEE